MNSMQSNIEISDDSMSQLTQGTQLTHGTHGTELVFGTHGTHGTTYSKKTPFVCGICALPCVSEDLFYNHM